MRIGGYLSATTNRFSTDNHNLPLHNYVRNLISSLSFSFLSKRLKQMQKRSFFLGGGGGADIQRNSAKYWSLFYVEATCI